LFWFCFYFCFTAAPLVIIISPLPPGSQKGEERAARRREKGVQGKVKKKEKRKCKSKSIYYAAMAWRGLQEACKTSESTNCSAHTPKVAYPRTQKEINRFQCLNKTLNVVG